MSVTTVKRYDTVGEFLAVMQGAEYARQNANSGRAANWRGCTGIPDATKIVRDGYKKHLSAIDSLLEKVSTQSPPTVGRVWEPSMAGPLPIVPAAIAGLPDCMLAPVDVASESHPLRVYVSVCLSAGCDEPVIAKRGAAIIALLQTLTRMRPTECYLFGDMGGPGYLCSPMVKLDSSPIDMSTASAALTSACMSRCLFFAWAEHHAQWGGQWAWCMPPNKEGNPKTREAIGAEPSDLVIYGGHLSESDLMIKDPCKWVAEQIATTMALVE